MQRCIPFGIAVAAVVLITLVSVWYSRAEQFVDTTDIPCKGYTRTAAADKYCGRREGLDMSADRVAAREELNFKVLLKTMDVSIAAAPGGARTPPTVYHEKRDGLGKWLDGNVMTFGKAASLSDLHTDVAGFVHESTSPTTPARVTFFDSRDAGNLTFSTRPQMAYVKYEHDPSRCTEQNYCSNIGYVLGSPLPGASSPWPTDVANPSVGNNLTDAKKACTAISSCAGVHRDASGTVRLVHSSDRVLNGDKSTPIAQSLDKENHTQIFYKKSDEKCPTATLGSPFAAYIKEVYTSPDTAPFAVQDSPNKMATRLFDDEPSTLHGVPQPSRVRTRNRTCQNVSLGGSQCFLGPEDIGLYELDSGTSDTTPQQKKRMYYVTGDRRLLKKNRESCCTFSRNDAANLKNVTPIKMQSYGGSSRCTLKPTPSACNATPNCAYSNGVCRSTDASACNPRDTSTFFQDGCNVMCARDTKNKRGVYRKDLAACIAEVDKCKYPTKEACDNPEFTSVCDTCTADCACTNTEHNRYNSGCNTMGFDSYTDMGSIYHLTNNYTALFEHASKESCSTAEYIRSPTDSANPLDTTLERKFKYKKFYVEKSKTDSSIKAKYTFRASNGGRDVELIGDMTISPNTHPNPWKGRLSFKYYDPFQRIVIAKDERNFDRRFRITPGSGC